MAKYLTQKELEAALEDVLDELNDERGMYESIIITCNEL